MREWWEALTAFQQVFICIAVPSTLLMVVQFILTLIGIGGGVDSDADGSYDGDTDGDFDGDEVLDGNEDAFNFGIVFRLFTLRGMIAFLAVMGWVGYGLDGGSLPMWATILIALGSGLAIMLLIGLLFYLFKRFQTSGNIDIRNAIGKSGSVYMNIPANRAGTGKVNVVVQERYGEYEAVTDENDMIPFGTEIVVIAISGADTLVVKRK